MRLLFAAAKKLRRPCAPLLSPPAPCCCCCRCHLLPLCAGAKESCIIEAKLPFAAALRPARTTAPLLLDLLPPALLLLLLLPSRTAQCCALFTLVPIWRSIIVVPIVIAKLSNVQLLAQPCTHLPPRWALLLLQLRCKLPAESCLEVLLVLV
jgi:hypothetical protein